MPLRLGRPRVVIDTARIVHLRAQEHSVRAIAGELGHSRGLFHKAVVNVKALRCLLTPRITNRSYKGRCVPVLALHGAWL